VVKKITWSICICLLLWRVVVKGQSHGDINDFIIQEPEKVTDCKFRNLKGLDVEK
jgi:hypothetical protein